MCVRIDGTDTYRYDEGEYLSEHVMVTPMEDSADMCLTKGVSVKADRVKAKFLEEEGLATVAWPETESVIDRPILRQIRDTYRLEELDPWFYLRLRDYMSRCGEAKREGLAAMRNRFVRIRMGIMASLVETSGQVAGLAVEEQLYLADLRKANGMLKKAIFL